MPVELVNAVSLGGFLSHYVSIALKTPDGIETYNFHLDGIDKNTFDSFKRLISDCCKKRKEEIQVEKKKERVQFVMRLDLDFQVLREYMEKGGLILSKTKCPICGGSIILPDNGKQIRCKHCGNVILAQDIFDKIQSLI
jgi:ribosomal protein S27AE